MRENNNRAYEGQSSIKVVKIMIDRNQREELFDKFQKFADKNAFAIRIAPFGPSGLEFMIDMWREDIMMIGHNPFNIDEFQIGFFDTNPAHPASDGDVNALISNLENLIEEIPHATFTVE